MLGTPPHPTDTSDRGDRTDRLLAAIRVTLVAALAYVVSFEAIRAFAIETAAFPAELAWSAPLLVDSFTTAASLVILWRYLRGDAWSEPWYAWTLVGCATAVSVALNVAHAPDRMAAQLFAALPPIALLGALELLMSVARTGLPHRDRTMAAEEHRGDRDDAAAGRSSVAVVAVGDGSLAARPQLPAPDHTAAAGRGPHPCSTPERPQAWSRPMSAVVSGVHDGRHDRTGFRTPLVRDTPSPHLWGWRLRLGNQGWLGDGKTASATVTGVGEHPNRFWR